MYIKKILTILSVIFSLFVPTFSIAAPLFTPGQTLYPTCFPTDIDCAVAPAALSGANSDITSLSALTDATTTNFYTTNFTLSNLNGLLFGLDGIVSAVSTTSLFANYLTVAIASTTFMTFEYASSTFASTSFVVNNFPTFTYASSTFPSFEYASSIFATLADTNANFVPYTGATTDVNLNTKNLITDGLIENSAVLNNINLSAASYVSDYPPAQNATYVKATGNIAGYVEYFATDPTKTLFGSAGSNAWESTNAPQRFHIDLGSTKIITRIYYENFHHFGTLADRDVKNFTFWGSNTDSDFADTVYADPGAWVQLTTATSFFDQHVGGDTTNPKYITVTNATPYRYYAFKFADNWGSSQYMGVRRIELQENATSYSTTFSTNNLQRMTILNNGNVGIGTPNPSTTLDVNGAITAVGNTYTAPAFKIAEDTGIFGSGGVVNIAVGNTTSYYLFTSASFKNNFSGGFYINTSGSLTTPTYTFNVDQNTGMTSGGLDSLSFVTGGTEKVRIDSFGNVGIGTSTPLAMLTVRSTTTTDILNLFETGGTEVMTVLENGNVGIGITTPDLPLTFAGTGGSGQKIHLYGTQANGYVIGVEPSDLRIAGGTAANDAITFRTQGYNGAERMKISGTGLIGIGTTTPSAKLDIYGLSTQPTTDLFGVSSSSNARLFTITSAGKVGIGTSNPSSTLSVSGNAEITGNQFFTNANSGIFFNTSITTYTYGILKDASNNLIFRVNGEKLKILNTGEVGIGTSSPASKLDIYGTAGSADIFGVSSSSNARLFTITSAGKVGIGTTTPGTALSVVGTTTSNGIVITNLTNSFLSVDANGNIIATTSPLSILSASSTYLKLDQTSPQTIASGSPIFSVGLNTINIQNSGYTNKIDMMPLPLTPIYTNDVPIMTSNTSPSGVASDSGDLGGAYVAWKAFDHDTTTNNRVVAANVGTFWLQYQFSSAKTILQYLITAEVNPGTGEARAPKDFTLQGSNNGSSFTTIDTRTSITGWASGETKTFSVTLPSSYIYYRLQITANNGGAVHTVEELQLMENTGAFVPEIAFLTNSVERMRFLQTGNIYISTNVGIGTSTPSANLDIYGLSAHATSDLFAVSSSSNARLFTIASNGSTTIASLTAGVVRSTASGALYTDNANYLTSESASTSFVTYDYASSTFASFAYASSTFLTINTAIADYVSTTTASSTYLKIADATSKYFPIASSTEVLNTAFFSPIFVPGTVSYDSDVVAAYDFEGNINDSVNGYNGTSYGTPFSSAQKYSNTSSFYPNNDGLNYATLPIGVTTELANASAWTVEEWLYAPVGLSQVQSIPYVFVDGGSYLGSTNLFPPSGHPYAGNWVTDGSVPWWAIVPGDYGNWIRINYEWTGTSTRIYRNGVLVSSANTATNLYADHPTGVIWLGRFPAYGTSGMYQDKLVFSKIARGGAESLNTDQSVWIKPKIFADTNGDIWAKNLTTTVNLTSPIWLSTSTASSTYLSIANATSYAKLDGTNQPFTGNINIATTSAEIKLTDGNFTRLTRTSTNNQANLYNQVEVSVGGSVATGGDVTYSGGYTVHTFTTTGQTFIPGGPTEIEYLVVAGGGGGGSGTAGGSTYGGGGGAGGMRIGTTTLSTSQTITIGAGGSSASYTNGATSSIGNIIEATGGGSGGAWAQGGKNGGSGGAAGYNVCGAGTGIAGQGHNAGASCGVPSGGGGSGAIGENGGTNGGNGGVGLASAISGVSTYYAGGGGGGFTNKGTGGNGGGGNGADGTLATVGVSGTTNTGGGGGGGKAGSVGGDGGSGIIIIRYPTPGSSVQEASLISSRDSAVIGEYGINTFGDGLGATHLNGNALYFDINGTNKLIVDSNGNLGIGTSTPGAKLDIYGKAGSSDIFGVSSSSNARLFTITSAGNVGIGTSTPPSLLSIVGPSGIENLLYVTNAPDSTTKYAGLFTETTSLLNYVGLVNKHSNNRETLKVYRNLNAVNTNAPVMSLIQDAGGDDQTALYIQQDGTGAGLIVTGGNVGIGTTTPASKLDIYGTAGSADIFGVSSSSNARLFTITSAGNVGIGTSTPSATLAISGTPTTTLLQLVGFGAGSLTTDANGNVLSGSDERLKDIQGEYSRGLEDIKKINPIQYKWKTETGYDTTNVYTGFSAQNMQEAIPEAVGSSSAGYLTLSDRPILAAIVNAVKEIGSFITKIENGIAYLTNIVVQKFTVGSDTSPSGITMYDRVTKEPYCVSMIGGVLTNENGICSSDASAVTTPAETPVEVAPLAITITGGTPITIYASSTYTDIGATALDSVDGDITANIIATGTVDTNILGTYNIVYTVMNSASNTVTATRVVNVVEEATTTPDTIAPVVTINGLTPIDIIAGDTYEDAGATATDNIDTSVTVTIDGAVDTTTAGIYTITYTATDTAGNIGTTTRTVNVN